MMASFIGFAGWAGAGCMLLAYALLSSRRIPAGLVFQILNVSGAFGLLLNGASHRAWPSVLLNLAWLLISVVCLARQRQQSPIPAPGLGAALTRGARRLRRGGRRARTGRWARTGQPRYRMYRDPVSVTGRPRTDLTSPQWIEARSL